MDVNGLLIFEISSHVQCQLRVNSYQNFHMLKEGNAHKLLPNIIKKEQQLSKFLRTQNVFLASANIFLRA